MTPIEATMLCRFTKAICPQQAIDEYTPDAWHEVLGDLRFEDAKAGVVAAAKVSPFVAPAEIRDQVKRIRQDRIIEFGLLPDPPPGLTDAEEVAWLAQLKRDIADGKPVAQVAAIEAAPDHAARRDAIVAGAFQKVPSE